MVIYVNSKPREFNEQVRISEALLSLNIQSWQGIAVAVNNQVVPKSVWNEHTLQPNDQLTLIKATQGG